MTPRDVIRAEAARLRRGMDPGGVIARDYECAPLQRRDALDDAVVYLMHSVAGPYLVGYPSPEIAARLILGATPASLAPELTRREAGVWCTQSEHVTPVEWLGAQVRQRHPEIPMASVSIPVLRWIDAALNDPERRSAALRTRHGMLGEHVVGGRVVDRLDELRSCDLRASVADTIVALTQRHAREQWDGPDELIPQEPWHDALPSGVTVLRTVAELCAEGEQCHHCVGCYAAKVHSGECIIVRVIAPNGKRSTAEITRGRVTQHLGPLNSTPDKACVLLLEQCRWS